ncbi:MAG: hypothetical protein EOO28_25325 [Comamonadaceae bacterium]|nr:MAG: hypothetical protein EOO28_25325 [Comamonadaceae bacterium]
MTGPIRRVPPIRPVAVVAPVVPPLPVSTARARPLRAGAVAASESSAASRQKWEDAENRPVDGLVVDPTCLPTSRQPQGEGESPSGEEESASPRDAVPQPFLPMSGRLMSNLRQAQFQRPDGGGEGPPPQIVQLSGLITAFALHSMSHGSWAARVPLADSILADTVLHLNCAQNILALRFDTTEWGSRYLIEQHSSDLLALLRKALPMLSAVYLSAQ